MSKIKINADLRSNKQLVFSEPLNVPLTFRKDATVIDKALYMLRTFKKEKASQKSVTSSTMTSLKSEPYYIPNSSYQYSI
jgi:hypothetical protein